MNQFLQDNYAPLKNEYDIDNIQTIIGEIPKELNGVLYRNGPNPQYPDADRHWFEGDGMLHMFSIKNGKINYRNRWIRTERFELERRIGKAYFNSFKNPFTDEVPSGTANTNIVWHGGKLLALQENSSAIEIDPFTLDTHGKWDYNQQIPQMSAHPHFDADTGEMHNYAYHPGSNHINYYVFNRHGTVIKSETINGPFSCFMHDFFITKEYVIFPFLPLIFSMERAQKGKSMLMWEPEQGSHISIMPRNGTSKNILWFETQPFHAYHFMNAFQSGNQIFLDGMKTSRANLFPDAAGKITMLTENPPQLTRWAFDLKNKTVKETQLDSSTAEFPRFDERFTGLNYRHGFAVASVDVGSKDAGFDSIIHYDLKTKSHIKREFGSGNIPSEPIFVPRHKTCDEGDGFLLSVVYNAARNSSNLYILDAMNINKEPLAIVQLPHRIPNGFHGNWCDL